MRGPKNKIDSSIVEVF